MNDKSQARYDRQMLLPQIGATGQQKLAAARVLLVGCGALGTVIADQLVRAGVGSLTIVDRDIVELTNLQRQTLFDESDATNQTPKAIAAAGRLRRINSQVEIAPIVADVHAGNLEELLRPGFDVILDGTDNVATRYLINDVAVKRSLPWIYGAAVGVEGRVMGIVPAGEGGTPCLRCIFPTPPSPQELPACDTAGVLGMGASIVAAYQAIEAIKILIGAGPSNVLMRMEFWTPRMHAVSTLDAKREDCVCCGQRRFEFLDALADAAVTLCGRSAVQVRPAARMELSLEQLAAKLATAGAVERNGYFVKCRLRDPAGVMLTVFPDGRTLVQGVNDLGRAKSIHARFVGG